MMRRSVLVPLGIGILALAGLAVMASTGVRVMPSWLAGWLFVLAVPAGALLVVSCLETFGEDPDSSLSALLPPLMPPLRRLLPLMPAASLLGLPVLLLPGTLYDPHAWPVEGIGRSWFAHGWFEGRLVLFLLLWSGLALVFATPSARPRRRLAGLAFALMLVTGTLAALDWVMSVEPGLASNAFGLLVLAGQAVSAIAAATLLAGPAARPAFRLPLLAMLALWMFLHFTQFLVVWSANKPSEVGWYLHRMAGLSAVSLWFAVLAGTASVALLLHRSTVRADIMAALARLVLLVRLVESFWLVTPAFRDGFVVTPTDLLCAVGPAALLFGIWRAGWLSAGTRSRHARA